MNVHIYAVQLGECLIVVLILGSVTAWRGRENRMS